MILILFGNIRDFLYTMQIVPEVSERIYQGYNIVREVPNNL